MEHMHDEMLNDIMLKLPLKTVARWKCVCKSWYSLLNSSDFIIQYLQLSNNKIRRNINDHDLILKFETENDYIDMISILSHETLGVLDTQKLSTYTQQKYNQIQGCRNSVVCITSDRQYTLKVLLWNPKTRQVKVVPKNSYCRGPSIMPHSYDTLFGFGFDDKNNDYKVVIFGGYPSSSHSNGFYYDVEVYSLKLDRWRLVRCNFKDRFLKVNTRRVVSTCTDGMCSWPVRHQRREAILSFDMSMEIIILTPLPSRKKRYSAKELLISRNGPAGFVGIVDLNGHVAFFDHVGVNFYNIWWLGEIGVEDSWTKLFIIVFQ
ncbi:hypothetical protein FNV43_RR06569 [Rhamnella rubrinervis]|uniref:F-box domain-containing protein n=1 Tax=Rhamnella rubrinervis TaxID=2594499 RepID=A0A8K0MLE7_9ROSA|nr:hypothetical protein FNV43_RR06569 [Rhamnella rubrinervis]